MIDRVEPKLPFYLVKVDRYPNNILLINRGLDDNAETIGQITIKDAFEEELWKEAIEQVNLLQKEKRN